MRHFLSTNLLLCFLLLANSAMAQESEGFGQNFTKSPKKQYGGVACQNNGGSYNGNYKTYFSYNDTSMTMTAGDDCRQVYTGGDNGCIFDVGDNGLTEISFDFNISGPCHPTSASSNALAFWICTMPWVRTAEVDFVEAEHGPFPAGLNTNFGGLPSQVGIFSSTDPNPWQGSITATFSGTGDNVQVSVSNTHNSSVASATLSQDNNYIFIMNMTESTESGCTLTISNLRAKGTVDLASNNCAGLQLSN